MRSTILSLVAALAMLSACERDGARTTSASSAPVPPGSSPTTEPPPPPSRACGASPTDWCPSPPGDPCGLHKNTAECRADPKCEGMPYQGESFVACKPDGKGFWSNCPSVGCILRK